MDITTDTLPFCAFIHLQERKKKKEERKRPVTRGSEHAYSDWVETRKSDTSIKSLKFHAPLFHLAAIYC